MSHSAAKVSSSLQLFFLREMTLLLRNLADTIQPFSFFVIVLLLFPLAVSSDSKLLAAILPGCTWVCVVLATMMSLDSVFRADFDDGTLEQWLINSRSLPAIIVAKVFAHWCLNGLLLSMFASLICLAMDVPKAQTSVLFISLLLGTVSLQFIGSIGAALTVSIRRSGMLLAVVILPLYIPVLIFGAGAVSRVAEGDSIAGPLYMLSAIMVLTVTLSPFAIGAALRNSLD